MSILIQAEENIDTGLGSVFNDINFPGVVLLATSGVIALIFIVRWMIRFQKEFTNFYIAENNKLRERNEALEEEIREKDARYSTAIRERIEYEQATAHKIAELRAQVYRHEDTISRHESTIDSLRRRIEGD